MTKTRTNPEQNRTNFPENRTKTRDLRTRAFVLRRTNYGETDRILNLLTPDGKLSALAKGVRREKSRLAGGIELFSLSDVVLHQGRSDLYTLTSAKMLQHYGNITQDLDRLTLASEVLKQLNRATEHAQSPEYFAILREVLSALGFGLSLELVEAWFWLRFAHARGEELNLYYDATGHKLQPDQTYRWDTLDIALRPDPRGPITADHIKFMRLLLASPLTLAAKVKHLDTLLPPVTTIAKALNQL